MLDLRLLNLDAEQAFVQSKLDEDTYMKLPAGCGHPNDSVLLSNKSQCGLKHTSQSWNELLASKLRGFGLEQCRVDPCSCLLRGDDAKV